MRSLVRTSFHEAGHAVVAELTGRRVLYASVRATDRISGWVSVLRDGVRLTDEQARALLAVAGSINPMTGDDVSDDPRVDLAGAAAELVFLGDYDRPGLRSDFDCVFRKLLFRDRVPLDVVAALAANLLVDATLIVWSNSEAVKAVAERLREESQISGDTVRELITQHRTKGKPATYETHRSC